MCCNEGQAETTQSLYNVSSAVDTGPSDIITEAQRNAIDFFLTCVLGTPLAMLGILTNLANLVVLAKQGLKDSVNISLFALAICDLAYVITVLPVNKFCFLDASDPLLSKNARQVFVPHGVMTRFALARLSSGLMALISTERALCVLTPLHFRRLVTCRRTAVAVGAIYVVIAVIFVPVWMMLEVKWFSVGGRLAAFAVFTKFYEDNIGFLNVFNDLVISVILPAVLLTMVAASTLLTIVRLKLASQWLQTVSCSSKNDPGISSSFTIIVSGSSSAHPGHSNTPQLTMQTPSSQDFAELELPQVANFSSNPKLATSDLKTKPDNNTMIKTACLDEKTGKLTTLLVTIAVIYIICLIPSVIATIVRLFIPEYSLNRRYHNSAAVVYAVDFLLETFNATVTFFVYVTMSSKFRMVLKSLLPRQCARRRLQATRP